MGVESRAVFLPSDSTMKRVTTFQLCGLSDSVSLLYVRGPDASPVSLRAARDIPCLSCTVG